MARHGGPRSALATAPFVRANIAHWRLYHFGLYVLAVTERPDQPIGRAGLRLEQGANGSEADMSVVLTEDSWDQGFGTEAVLALLAIGRYLELPLVGRCEADHPAAVSVMENAGLARAGNDLRHGRTLCRYVSPEDGTERSTVRIDTDESVR